MLIILFFIFLEDIRSNAVYWFWFLLLAAAGLTIRLMVFSDEFLYFLINMCFLTMQAALIAGWYAIRKRRWDAVTKDLIGWGDILFLVAVAFYLSSLNFLVYYVSSLIFTILVWFAWQWHSRERNLQVPLAGLQALFLIILIVFDRQSSAIDLLNDSWILTIMGI